MRVGLALEIDSTLDRLAPAVAELDRAVNIFFSDRQYGADVENIFVGVILTTPDSERFHAARKLRYKAVRKIRIPGQVVELRNVVEYDVKPDFEAFLHLDVEQARRKLASELVSSLDTLEKHRAKFANFDVARFGDDLKTCLGRVLEHSRFG